RLRDGLVTPLKKVKSGEDLDVKVTVRRAGWIGWLVGSTKQLEATITTPRTRLRATLLHPGDGGPIGLRFDGPTGVLKLTLPGFGTQRLTFQKPKPVVQTGLHATGSNRFGTATVASAARTWEVLSPPVAVSWFPAGERLQALVKP